MTNPLPMTGNDVMAVIVVPAGMPGPDTGDPTSAAVAAESGTKVPVLVKATKGSIFVMVAVRPLPVALEAGPMNVKV